MDAKNPLKLSLYVYPLPTEYSFKLIQELITAS